MNQNLTKQLLKWFKNEFIPIFIGGIFMTLSLAFTYYFIVGYHYYFIWWATPFRICNMVVYHNIYYVFLSVISHSTMGRQNGRGS